MCPTGLGLPSVDNIALAKMQDSLFECPLLYTLDPYSRLAGAGS